VDWSNLTSGPGGPTASDSARCQLILSGDVFPKVRLLLRKAYSRKDAFDVATLPRSQTTGLGPVALGGYTAPRARFCSAHHRNGGEI